MLSKAGMVYIALELLIALLSVAGNVLVCWSVCLNSNLQSITNYFVVSLAVADIAVGLLAIPFAVTVSTGFCGHFHGCLFIACFVLVLTQSSIFSLLAIALDRYVAITIPLRYNSLVTSRRAKAIIAVCWILSVIIGLTPMMGWNMRSSNSSNSSCPSGCVLLPLLAMLVIYARIFMAARQQLWRMEQKLSLGHAHADGSSSSSSSSSSSRSRLQREVHAAKSLAIIVGLFAMCWLPVHIINCFTLFCPRCARPPGWIMYLAIILSHANSVVNPFIYAYRIRDFRHTFRKIIGKHILRQSSGQFGGTSAAGVTTSISAVDSSFGIMANGGTLDHSHSPHSHHGRLSNMHSTGSQWKPRPNLTGTDFKSIGCRPADPAFSTQSKQLCLVGCSDWTLEDVSPSKSNAEIMVVKHCSIHSKAHFGSLPTRTSYSAELTEVS
ncbi:adenosine A2a receptor b isoform X2 [Brachyhypopomus gauderio]|uniref:adenosine A2a receptor b isoform X2 n=1 Tax=Brachyhypopomus gauderio TaxID=698409 RepID=UPI004042023F